MPAPNPPTSVVLTTEEGTGIATLDWEHDQANLDRWEVLVREDSSSPWDSLAMVPAADLLVSGNDYSFDVELDKDWDVTVRALNAAGEVSTTNPFRRRTNTIEGVWLLPYRNGKLNRDLIVRVQAQTADFERPLTSEIFEVPARQSKVVQFGRQHLYEGSIDGLLLDHTYTAGPDINETVTSQMWANRLKDIIRHQHKYRVSLVMRHFRLKNVVFPEGHQVSAFMNPDKLYTVSFRVIEVEHRNKWN